MLHLLGFHLGYLFLNRSHVATALSSQAILRYDRASGARSAAARAIGSPRDRNCSKRLEAKRQRAPPMVAGVPYCIDSAVAQTEPQLIDWRI